MTGYEGLGALEIGGKEEQGAQDAASDPRLMPGGFIYCILLSMEGTLCMTLFEQAEVQKWLAAAPVGTKMAFPPHHPFQTLFRLAGRLELIIPPDCGVPHVELSLVDYFLRYTGPLVNAPRLIRSLTVSTVSELAPCQRFPFPADQHGVAPESFNRADASLSFAFPPPWGCKVNGIPLCGRKTNETGAWMSRCT